MAKAVTRTSTCNHCRGVRIGFQNTQTSGVFIVTTRRSRAHSIMKPTAKSVKSLECQAFAKQIDLTETAMAEITHLVGYNVELLLVFTLHILRALHASEVGDASSVHKCTDLLASQAD